MAKQIELDDREKQMLKLVTKAKSSEEIAEKIGHTPGTTRVYLHYLYRKIGVTNKTAAAMWWVENQRRYS